MYSLLIDCSHRINFIGLFNEDTEWLADIYFEGQPLESLSQNITALLNKAAVDKSTIQHFYTPSNPGSQLGIRLTQIFVQTWIKTQCPSALWSEYNGLYMCARLLANKKPRDTKKHLITERGRRAWSILSISSDFISNPKIQSLDAASVAELEGTVYYLPQVKRWQPPQCTVEEITYDPKQFLTFLREINNANFDPTQLQDSPAQYQKWEAPNLNQSA